MKEITFTPTQIIYGVIFVVPIIVFLWLASQYFSFSGHLSIEYDFKGKSAMISEWYPFGRALDREKNLRTGEVYQSIVGDPVYLDVSVPRSFDSVDVTVTYQNPSQPFIEMGLVTNRDPWSVHLQPFESQVIDEALASWSRVEDDAGQTLLQRTATFDSVAAFLNNPPRDQHIGIYRLSLPLPYEDEQYTPTEGGMVIDRFLRGSHEFWTYIAHETLVFAVDVQDMNREFNDDRVIVEVYDAVGTLVATTEQPDDGIVDAREHLSEKKTIALSLPDLPAGAYRIRLTTTDDIILTQIRTGQEKFVIAKHLFIIDNEEYRSLFPEINTDASTLWFQGRVLSAKTDHPAGLQTTTIDGDRFSIDRIHHSFFWEDQEGDGNELHSLVLPKSDLDLLTKGFFAFSEESFFDPDFLIETINETTRIENLDFILFAEYTSPQKLPRFRKQPIHLDFDGVAGDRKDLIFILSLPGIERRSAVVNIANIQFDFERESLYRRLLKRIRS